MREGWVCRGCKGPPLPWPPLGPCPNCKRYLRHEMVRLRDGELDGADIEPMRDGEPMSADALMAGEEEKDETKRPSGIAGLDWVFDGGLPRVGTILLAAKEGSGKTTLLWQVGQRLSKQKVPTLFESSEQTLRKLRRQFKRLGPCHGMVVHCAEDKDSLVRAVEKERPEFVVLDSVHHVTNVTDEGGFDVAAGGERAVTIIAKEFNKLAEDFGCLVVLVGHMNNDGTMAGGSHLRHAVDATLTLTRSDDKRDPKRILEFWGKSRFGDASKRALFVMNDTGLKDYGPLLNEGETADQKPPTKPGLRLVPPEDE